MMIAEMTASPPREDHSSKMRVLIVEDNRDSAKSMAMLVRLLGYKAIVAFDGPTALAEFEADPADVVLLDIGLPRMDGFEVARRLRTHAVHKLPFIIAITGYGQDEDRRRSQEVGIDLHLLKPADPEELERMLSRLSGLVTA